MNSQLKSKSPAVFFANGIGDHIINLPSLRALADVFAGALTLICAEGSPLFLFADLFPSRTVRARIVRSNGGCEFDPEAIAEIVGPCDAFISLVPWISHSLSRLRTLVGQRISIGFSPEFTVHVPLDFGKHSADLSFDLVREVAPDVRFDDFAGPAPIPRLQRNWVARLRKNLPRKTRILSVHVDSTAEKMWSAPQLINVIDVFLTAYPDFLAFVVGTRSQHLDSGDCRDRVIPCYGLSLAQSCSLVAQSDLFIGIDSCMLHMADFARVPGVGLFGPTRAEEFGFRVGPNITIQGDGTLDSVTTTMVTNALDSLLKDPDQRSLWSVQ